MPKRRIFLIVGARPNFMKIAPIYKEMKKYAELFEPIILHTGQHYDEKMSKIFFDDLELPKPHIYLGVGSGSHAVQTAEVMKKFERELERLKPELLILVGDVNSTLACSLTAAKIRYGSDRLHKCWTNYDQYIASRNITALQQSKKQSNDRPLIAHVEAGLRSFDSDMPEEINRTITDSLSDLLFTTCVDGDENLIAEGFDTRKIFFVGNVMIDSLQFYLNRSEKSTILDELAAHRDGNGSIRRYALVTLHRPSNVDDPPMLTAIVTALTEISKEIPVIFPVHPRTRKLLAQSGESLRRKIDSSEILFTEPIGYLDFLHLQTRAALVLTDSGGIQEETSYLGVPCLTLRPNTERPITIRAGTNKLVPLRREAIVADAQNMLKLNHVRPAKIKYWDGNAAERIVHVLADIIAGN